MDDSISAIRPTNSPSIRTSLVLKGFGDDPALVTRKLGRDPTREGRSGEQRVNQLGVATGKPLNEADWSLHSRLASRTTLAAQVADLLAQLDAPEILFATLPAGTLVTLFCTVIPDGDLPSLEIDRESTGILGKIKASVTIHIVNVDQGS